MENEHTLTSHLDPVTARMVERVLNRKDKPHARFCETCGAVAYQGFQCSCGGQLLVGVEIEFTLPIREAVALAQLAKRFGWTDARQLSTHDSEAYRMLRATHQLFEAIRLGGVLIS